MRALAIVHQRDAGPGVFADVFAARGADLDEWHPVEREAPLEEPAGYDAVLVFGGAMNAGDEGRHPWLRDEKRLLRGLLDAGRPVLGVCLGAQLLAEAAGAEVRRAPAPEIGWYRVEVTEEGAGDPVIGPLAPSFEAFEWHSYEFGLPEGAATLARSEICAQAFRCGERAWGIQFHAEVGAEDAERWIRDYRTDPDAVRIGIDPAELRTETVPRLGAWHELGRGVCARFLDAVEAAQSGVT